MQFVWPGDLQCHGIGSGLASQASRVYLRGMSIHTATGEASHVYSISRHINMHRWGIDKYGMQNATGELRSTAVVSNPDFNPHTNPNPKQSKGSLDEGITQT